MKHRNCTIRMCSERISPNMIKANMLAVILEDDIVSFAATMYSAAQFVYDRDRNEYLDEDEAREWVFARAKEIGAEAFGKELIKEQIRYLKTINIHVSFVGEDFDPKNN